MERIEQLREIGRPTFGGVAEWRHNLTPAGTQRHDLTREEMQRCLSRSLATAAT